MPRPLRFLPADSIAHVVNRGNDKRPLFDQPRDFEQFLRLVMWAKAKCPVRIVAYCVMSNHWHFAFWCRTDNDVSLFLHLLTTTHAMGWRRRTGTVGDGHVYQDRFHASNVFTEAYYFNVLRYIEQNPLRAGLVTSCCDWRWSSLSERLRTGGGILDEGPAPLPIDWRQLVDAHLEETAIEEIRSSLRRH